MQITTHDEAVRERTPTVSINTSLGREFYRSATWEDEGATVSVTAIAFVTGIRARRDPDGSVDLVDQVSRFSVLGKDEFVQPMEVALFLWDRTRAAWDGTTSHETAIDHSNEVGLYYSPTVEAAEEQCRIFIESLDFEENFDPAAWK